MFGYFIPGVRHFTAYAAGMSDLKPPLFALFAYSGGFVWCLTFMTLGYLLGERWEAASAKVHRYVLLAVAATAVIAAAAWAARKWRSRVQ
jgi:membrane protein DedA with SNARE-associated domain